MCLNSCNGPVWLKPIRCWQKERERSQELCALLTECIQGRQTEMIREQDSFSILTWLALSAASALPLPIVLLFRLTLSSSLNTFLTLPFPGMGWRIQEQSGPHRRGSDLWGAEEERHRVPNVGAGDTVTHTHTSEGKLKQLKCVQTLMCKDPSIMWLSAR